MNTMSKTVWMTIVSITTTLIFRETSGQSIRFSPIRLSSGICFSEETHNAIRNSIRENLTRIYCPKLYESFSNQNRPVLVTTNYGSSKGDYWDDVISFCNPMIVGIRSIELQTQRAIIISIQVTYLLANGELYSAPKHGGEGLGLEKNTIQLAEDERLVQIKGSLNGTSIIQLAFVSLNSQNVQQVYGPFGGTTGEATFEVVGYILGFKGYSGSSIQGFGAYYLPPLVKLNDSSGGECRDEVFDDRVDTVIPPVVAIRTIQIYHKLLIHGIQTTYALLGGSLYQTNLTGSAAVHNERSATVTLSNSDIIYKVSTNTYHAYPRFLSGLIFSVSINGSSKATSVRYGPYGTGNVARIVTQVNVIGFHGYFGFNGGLNVNNVCQIGFYRVDFNSPA